MTLRRNTKTWNTNMETVEPKEVIYIDYRDEHKTTVSSVKFKTEINKLENWIRAHKDYYVNSEANYQNLCTTVRSNKSIMDP